MSEPTTREERERWMRLTTMWSSTTASIEKLWYDEMCRRLNADVDRLERELRDLQDSADSAVAALTSRAEAAERERDEAIAPLEAAAEAAALKVLAQDYGLAETAPAEEER